jgi:hypothetical protein
MKKNQSIVIGVIVAAVAVGSFFAGNTYQRSKQASLTTGHFGQNGFMGGRGGLGARGQMMGGSANASNFAAGEIIEKDADSITVKTRDGGSKIVYFSSSTDVGKFAKGSASDLKKGQQVMVSGKSSGESLTAKNIQIRPKL